jgi:GNAT superfamily N-acetyltransferase
MHPFVTAARFTARTRQPIAEADHERTASAEAARPRRLSLDEARADIRLRCLAPADAHHITDLLERLSPHSRYQRYFRLLRSIPPADAERFVAANPGHLAVGAFDDDVLVGAAQYFRSSELPDHAEVAVEVADSHHRRRVGARLVDELAQLATGEGITHFTATVLAENRPVLGLIRHTGWNITTTRDGIYTDVVVALPPGQSSWVPGRATHVFPHGPGLLLSAHLRPTETG